MFFDFALLLHAAASFWVLFFALCPKKILIHLRKLPVQADFDGNSCENSCIHWKKHFAICQTISESSRSISVSEMIGFTFFLCFQC